MHKCFCLHVCHMNAWYPRKPEEIIGSLGTGVTDSVSHRVGMRVEARNSGRAVSAITHWLASPAPHYFVCLFVCFCLTRVLLCSSDLGLTIHTRLELTDILSTCL